MLVDNYFTSFMSNNNGEQFLYNMFKNNKVVLVSTTYCSYCTKLKMLLIEQKIRFVSLEVDIIPNGRDIFNAASQLSRISTVPQLFLSGKYFGDYDYTINFHTTNNLKEYIDSQ